MVVRGIMYGLLHCWLGIMNGRSIIMNGALEIMNGHPRIMNVRWGIDMDVRWGIIGCRWEDHDGCWGIMNCRWESWLLGGHEFNLSFGKS